MTYLPDSAVKWIVIHYSATPIEIDVSAADIDAMHRERGFRKIGYHLYGRRRGGVETGRDLSRNGAFEVGAHVRGKNSISVGYCYEGGVTQDSPNIGFDSRTPAQIADMIREVDALLERFPRAKVAGHRDIPGTATQCPGFDAGAWWDQVQADRQAKAKRGALALIIAAIIAFITSMFKRRK